MKDSQAWNRFVREGLHDPDSGNGMNTVYPFTKMTKLFGRAYLEYLAASYAVKDELSDLEWAQLNGGVPQTFIDSKVRPESLKLNLNLE